MEEVWKPYIIGWSHTDYEVSTLGRVRNIHSKTVLKPQIKNSGYYYVILHVDGRRLTRYVHRLVAETFHIVRFVDEIWVNHKDGNKLNNSKNNLEWVTPSYNTKHAFENNLTKNKGENSTLGKYNDDDIHKVCQLIQNGVPTKEIFEITGVSETHIRDLGHGKIRQEITSQYGFEDTSRKNIRHDVNLKTQIKSCILDNKSNNEIISIFNLEKNSITKSLLARCRKELKKFKQSSTTRES